MRATPLLTVSILCIASLAGLSETHAQRPLGAADLVPRFARQKSGLELERRTLPGTFFDVVGRKSAVFGYENRSFEAWVYPLKLLDDFELSFQLQGYPLEIPGAETAVSINVRPEAATFTYSHAAFTVRQIIFAPIDEQGIVMLLDVQSVLPLTVTASFRPKLRLMWPAGLMTGYVGWDERSRIYTIGEESNRFVGMVGSPAARDLSLMPYQEKPRDVPVRFSMETPAESLKSSLIPIVIAGSTEGRAQARVTYDRLLASVQSLYAKNAAHYERLLKDTTRITTPDERLNRAYDWARVGIDKGLATNPYLGTGLVAGFRTSGDSERPGFAWFFGRDSMWTALAINSYGDFSSTRLALDFLRKFQRPDGKIPHEISQSASLIPWFTDYGYPWASADATPLYLIAHADYWRASGDLDFIKKNWDSLLKAYRFSAATDTDGNDLIENTGAGHGWVEGGALYPPHEEIYMQAIWIEALGSIAELADQVSDKGLATEARAAAERTRASVEKTYWLAGRDYYAFATNRPQATPRVAEPGPGLALRQARLNELSKVSLIDEDTVLPAVGLWWRKLDDKRAQLEIDHLGSGAMATDWGARIISNESKLYDPLSYHYGSVWPLFTGWTAMAAYQYGRPHVGYQALMANALLTWDGALGCVTELLSGDFNASFGRSSDHQVWSEAMVVTPLIRGLLGLEVSEGGRRLSFAPRLPANWDRVEVRNVVAGDARYDLTLERSSGREAIKVERQVQANSRVNGTRATSITIAPGFPLSANIRAVTVNGSASKFEVHPIGDIQHVEVSIDGNSPVTSIVFNYDEGTEVYIDRELLRRGAGNEGLRILRSRADAGTLHLTLEGLGGRTYELRVRTPRRIGEVSGARVIEMPGRDAQLFTTFEGPEDKYVRRELALPLRAK